MITIESCISSKKVLIEQSVITNDPSSSSSSSSSKKIDKELFTYIQEQINSFALNFKHLSENNSKVLNELNQLKESVKIILEKNNYKDGNFSDYDEEDDTDVVDG